MRSTRIACLLLSAATLLIGSVAVTPAAHAAKARGYSVSTSQLPDGKTAVVRWDPCADPITYRVNLSGLKPVDRARALRETKVKVGQLAKASGLRFTYQGETAYVPRANHETEDQPAQLVIAYVRPNQTDLPLAGNVAGFGGTRSGWATHGDFESVTLRVESGYVVVDAPQTSRWIKSVKTGGVSRANVLAHELGHAVGLGHVKDRRQVMNATIQAKTPAQYAAGDRAGLAKVGRAAGCAPSAIIEYEY